MCYIFLILIQGIWIWKIVECALSWEVVHHKENQHGYTWEEARTICEANNQELAIVDSQEKWEKVKYKITGGNRYTAEKDVYIGLTFDTTLNNFTWVTGPQASWMKWFENEPYYTETRHCVRLDVYAEYYFRTTDCAYKHHFVCSHEVYVPDSTTDPVTTTGNPDATAASGIKKDMVVGLSVGFGIFLGIGIFICLLCRCCCNFTDKKVFKTSTETKLKPSKSAARKQYEIFMNQTEGVDYHRAKSSASASMNRNQYYDDDFDFDHAPSRVIDVEPNIHTRGYYGNKMDDVSLNDSSSPATDKSFEHMTFM